MKDTIEGQFHFLDANGHCRSTLRLSKFIDPVDDATYEMLWQAHFRELQASATENGTTAVVADDTHVCVTPPPTEYDVKRARLDELRAKGWANLTPEERDEANALKFDLGL